MAEFDDLVDKLDEQSSSGLKQNLFATEDFDPDHEAQVVKISKDFNASPEMVRTSFDEFKKKHLGPKPDLVAEISAKNPGLSGWLAQDPVNVSTSKDDLPKLKSIEDSVSRYGFLSKTYKSLNAGAASAISGLTKFPKLAYDVAAYPVNYVGEKLGYAPVSSDEYFKDGLLEKTTKFFDSVSEYEKNIVVETNQSTIDLAKEGKYSDAGAALYYQVLNSVPNTAVAILSTIAGAPSAGMGAIFASASGSKYEENLKAQEAQRQELLLKGELNAPEISKGEAVLSAVSSGTIETVTESLFGAFNGLKKSVAPLVKSLSKEAGVESTKQVYKEFFKTMAKSSVEEGAEEMISSASNDFADYMLDINKDALKGSLKRMIESGLVGASSGGFITSPSALGIAYQQKRAVKDAELRRDTLLAMGKEMADSKLKERLPEKHKEYIDKVTKGTPVENVYIPIEKFEAYFQKKNEDPVAAASQIGVSKSYDEAKVTGDLVEIPLSTWAQKIVGTEAEGGLANDTKFARDELTYNEATIQRESSKEQLQQAEQQYRRDEQIISETREIVKDIETKLVESGVYTKNQAKQMAITIGESYRVRSSDVYEGASPLAVYKQEGLRIKGFEKAPEGISGFEQSAELSDLTSEKNSLVNDIVATINPEVYGFKTQEEFIDKVESDPTYYKSKEFKGNKELKSKIKTLVELNKKITGLSSQVSTNALKQEKNDKSIRGFFDPVSRLVGLVKKDANLSTFLHEGGHVFLEQLSQDYTFLKSKESISEKQQAFLERAESALEYLGVNSFDEIKTEHHEKWARSFEAYLMEGKAPSTKLQKAFDTFKIWLTSIYKSVKGLGVELTPEIRGVFDRIIATEEELSRARGNYESLIDDPVTAGMDKALAAKWLKTSNEAREEATKLVSDPVMEDYKKKQDELYKKELKETKERIKLEISTLPEQIALDAINNNESVKKMPKEIQAELLGYKDVSSLDAALEKARQDIEVIDQRAEELLKNKYPDRIDELESLAKEAVHNERQAEKLRIEAEFLASKMDNKALAARLIARLPASKILKEEAYTRIQQRKISDIKPHVFELAERRAAKEAASAFKKSLNKNVEETQKFLEQAFEAKRKELLNHEMFKAAYQIQKQVDKKVKDYKKLFKSNEDLSKGRDIDYVNAARSVLAEFGITRSDKTAEEYLSKTKKYERERYEGLMNIIRSATEDAANYKEVTASSFEKMTRAVDALWSLSRSTEMQTIEGKKVERAQVVAEILDQSSESVKTKANQSSYESNAKKHNGFKSSFLRAKSALVRVEHWVNFMDRGNPTGPFRKYIWNPIYESQLKYDEKKNNVIKQFRDLLRDHARNLKQEPINAPELQTQRPDGSFAPFQFENKMSLIMAILHSGNKSNLSKLLRGYGWGVETNGVLDTSSWDQFTARMRKEGVLTKTDYDFAQNVWNLMDSIKGDLQKTHKELEGYYFEEVSEQEFTNEFGTYKGGYIPAKVDTDKVVDSRTLEEIDIFEKNNPSFAFPSTGAGATKTRNERFARRLSLNANLLGTHIDWALRYTYFEPRVQEVARLINDQTFAQELNRVDENIRENLTEWLKRTAQQRVSIPSTSSYSKGLESAARYFRTSAAMQVMFGNVTNTLQQFTGLVVAMTKVSPKYIRNGLFEYLKGFKGKDNLLTNDIYDKSSYMKNLQASQLSDVQQEINEIISNPSVFQSAREFAIKHTYILQGATQNIVNTIVWQGAYAQAISKGLSESQAIQEADSSVRLTQGSTRAIDVSSAEVGTPLYRMFVQFAGYFNMLANLNGFEMKRIIDDLGIKKGGGKLFYVYATGFMLPAVLSELIVKSMSGNGFDEDDDDNYLDDALGVFAGSQLKTSFAMVPAAGQFLTASYNRAFTDNIYDDRLNMSLAISTIDGLVGFPVEAYKQLEKDSTDYGKLSKDFLVFLGTLSQTPIGAFGKPVKYLSDVADGDIEPSGPFDFTRGLVTGKGDRR